MEKYLLEEATYQRGNEEPKRYSVSSVNNFVKSIRSFFRFLNENELIQSNPALKVKRKNSR